MLSATMHAYVEYSVAKQAYEAALEDDPDGAPEDVLDRFENWDLVTDDRQRELHQLFKTAERAGFHQFNMMMWERAQQLATTIKVPPTPPFMSVEVDA